MSKCDMCKYQDRSDSVGGMYFCKARKIFADLSDCGCFKKKHMTNADRIRSMTDEELAKWIVKHDMVSLEHGFLTEEQILHFLQQESEETE